VDQKGARTRGWGVWLVRLSFYIYIFLSTFPATAHPCHRHKDASIPHSGDGRERQRQRLDYTVSLPPPPQSGGVNHRLVLPDLLAVSRFMWSGWLARGDAWVGGVHKRRVSSAQTALKVSHHSRCCLTISSATGISQVPLQNQTRQNSMSVCIAACWATHAPCGQVICRKYAEHMCQIWPMSDCLGLKLDSFMMLLRVKQPHSDNVADSQAVSTRGLKVLVPTSAFHSQVICQSLLLIQYRIAQACDVLWEPVYTIENGKLIVPTSRCSHFGCWWSETVRSPGGGGMDNGWRW
jgi:hypothetical protein